MSPHFRRRKIAKGISSGGKENKVGQGLFTVEVILHQGLEGDEDMSCVRTYFWMGETKIEERNQSGIYHTSPSFGQVPVQTF